MVMRILLRCYVLLSLFGGGFIRPVRGDGYNNKQEEPIAIGQIACSDHFKIKQTDMWCDQGECYLGRYFALDAVVELGINLGTGYSDGTYAGKAMVNVDECIGENCNTIVHSTTNLCDYFEPYTSNDNNNNANNDRSCLNAGEYSVFLDNLMLKVPPSMAYDHWLQLNITHYNTGTEFLCTIPIVLASDLAANQSSHYMVEIAVMGSFLAMGVLIVRRDRRAWREHLEREHVERELRTRKVYECMSPTSHRHRKAMR